MRKGEGEREKGFLHAEWRKGQVKYYRQQSANSVHVSSNGSDLKSSADPGSPSERFDHDTIRPAGTPRNK